MQLRVEVKFERAGCLEHYLGKNRKTKKHLQHTADAFLLSTRLNSRKGSPQPRRIPALLAQEYRTWMMFHSRQGTNTCVTCGMLQFAPRGLRNCFQSKFFDPCIASSTHSFRCASISYAPTILLKKSCNHLKKSPSRDIFEGLSLRLYVSTNAWWFSRERLNLGTDYAMFKNTKNCTIEHPTSAFSVPIVERRHRLAF